MIGEIFSLSLQDEDASSVKGCEDTKKKERIARTERTAGASGVIRTSHEGVTK